MHKLDSVNLGGFIVDSNDCLQVISKFRLNFTFHLG